MRIDPIFAQEMPEGSIFILDEITERKRVEQALLISERLAATGRLAHTIAHEINNPLEAITNLMYLLRGAIHHPEAAQQYLVTAEQELERVSRISRQILSFNRESSVPVELPIGGLIEDVLALHNRAIVDKHLRIRKEWRSSAHVCVFPAQMRQVFANLLRNAIEASNSGGEIRIRVGRCTLWNHSGEPALRISIADHGVGIPAENMERIFDAFFTTKALKGSGVGLWLSSTIVYEHQGKLRVRSTTGPRSGTCMSVLLPVSKAAAAGDAETTSCA